MGHEAHHQAEGFSAAGKVEDLGEDVTPLKDSAVPEVPMVLAYFLEAQLKSSLEAPAGLVHLVAHVIPVEVLTLNLEVGVPVGPSSPGDHVQVNHPACEVLSFLADDPSSSLVKQVPDYHGALMDPASLLD